MRAASTGRRRLAAVAALAVVAGASAGLGGRASCQPSTDVETQVLAANDLGMHCIDKEYSVFSILPPFNVLQAQVVQRVGGGPPEVVGTAEVDLFYAATADPSGSLNSTSLGGKTAFWDHAYGLFGASLAPGEGLLGLYMPADAPTPGPQPFHYDGAEGVFRADGIPITPIDDSGAYNPYPVLRLEARDVAGGETLATLDVTVPVSQEVDCQGCHRTGEVAADDPGIPWSAEADLEVQTKRNVLILHDAREGTDLVSAQPVLCAGCHYSPALDLAGTGPVGPQIGNPWMSATMHAYHGELTDDGGAPLFPSGGSPEQTCFKCHPGVVTQCARGAMNTGGMYCHDCHGDMAAVGGLHPLEPGGSLDGSNDGQPRRAWIDVPRCQACHTGDSGDHLEGADLVLAGDGIRLRQAWRLGDPSASPILASASRFAENPGTLYRKSTGHGGLLCTSCHGSPHAIWPNADAAANDNLAAVQLQGHAGTLIECDTCHDPADLRFALGGPHGMHVVGSADFVKEQHKEMWQGHRSECEACHGLDLEGTVLSRTAETRVFQVEGRSIVLPAGEPVHCTHCHRDPRLGDLAAG